MKRVGYTKFRDDIYERLLMSKVNFKRSFQSFSTSTLTIWRQPEVQQHLGDVLRPIDRPPVVAVVDVVPVDHVDVVP